MAVVPQYEMLEQGAAPALDLIRRLASDVGPRRPCSEAESAAAGVAVAWLAEHGVPAKVETFKGYSTFALPFGLMLGTSLAGALLQQRGKRIGDLLAAGALAGIVLEGDLRVTPVSDLLARRQSTNVVASVAPKDEERLRVCLCGHLDTSRSGLMFHPRLVTRLTELFLTPLTAAALAALGPLTRRMPGSRLLNRATCAALAFGLVMLAERELRGEDVPGANDNASGCGVAAQLAAECAARPLAHTRVDLLLTGCEEVGMLGAQAYVREGGDRIRNTVFINFDSVGGDAPVRYILKEGMPVGRPASPRLIALGEKIAAQRPELGLIPGENTGALTTDATVALAHDHEAITFLARDRTIPNYHWPTDTYENLSPRTVAITLEAGRCLLAELDGEAGGGLAAAR